MKSFFSYNFADLKTLLAEQGFKEDVASKLYNWHHKKREVQPLKRGISLQAQDFIQNHMDFKLPQMVAAHESNDKTVKFIFELHDGRQVESVLIPFHRKYSLCVSSQVGCAMKCSFCYTGKQGFQRHLKTQEIVGQYLKAWRWLKTHRPGEERILNIVFMGQGEPLHNFDAVKKACEIFLTSHGVSIGPQKITVSTSGYLPGLKRWKNEMPSVNLALSLHSPFSEKRNELIPINQKYPLADVLNCIDQLHWHKKQFVTYEYLMIKEFNDSSEDAHATGQLLQGKAAYINLIPFNSFPGAQYQRPEDDSVLRFKEILDTYRIPTLIRETKGDQVLAACGQLNTSSLAL